MTHSWDNFYVFQISKLPSFGPGWDSHSQPSDLWGNNVSAIFIQP